MMLIELHKPRDQPTDKPLQRDTVTQDGDVLLTGFSEVDD